MATETSTDRIKKYLSQLTDAGVKVDDTLFELPLKDQEKMLKAEVEKIPAAPPPYTHPTLPGTEERMRMLELQLKESREQQAKTNALIDGLMKAEKEKPENKGKTGLEITQDPYFIAAMRNIRGSDPDEDGTLRDGYVPPEDRMERPVTIFANKSGIQIWFRTENGMRIGLPAGVKAPLTFKLLWRIVDPQTNKMSVRYYMDISNNRLWEWMKKHEMFGKDFFESSSDAIASDAGEEWAKSLSRYATALTRLTDHQIIAQCALLGLPTNASWSNQQYIDILAKKFADDEFLVKHQAKFDKMREIATEQLLAEGAAVVAK